jgi:hypothetical protein
VATEGGDHRLQDFFMDVHVHDSALLVKLIWSPVALEKECRSSFSCRASCSSARSRINVGLTPIGTYCTENSLKQP